MIKKLISGGQTGADSCIIEVGRRLGVPIGGLVPKGWLTEEGAKPVLRELGFTESEIACYEERTCRNVEQGDVTLIFAADLQSDGTSLTVAHAKKIGRPYLVVDPFEPAVTELVRRWLRETDPGILNVAGNRESVAPGIARRAENVLCAALGLRTTG